MKRLLGFLSLLFLIFLPIFMYAQDVVPILPPVSNEDFLGLLIQSIGGLKGASTLAIVGVVVQLLMKFVGTPFADGLFKNAGPWKLSLVGLLSWAGGVLSLMQVSHLSFGAAFVHSSSLMAFMVLANQIYKQFLEQKKKA